MGELFENIYCIMKKGLLFLAFWFVAFDVTLNFVWSHLWLESNGRLLSGTKATLQFCGIRTTVLRLRKKQPCFKHLLEFLHTDVKNKCINFRTLRTIKSWWFMVREKVFTYHILHELEHFYWTFPILSYYNPSTNDTLDYINFYIYYLFHFVAIFNWL